MTITSFPEISGNGNLLYLPNDEGHVSFVDFVRVCRHGIDRCSACLNPEAGLGVDKLRIMQKSHDIKNLERLMSQPSMWQ